MMLRILLFAEMFLDLAVGIIIGLAFANIVNAVVDNILKEELKALRSDLRNKTIE